MKNFSTRPQRKNKFNAITCSYDGRSYHSRKEANYAAELDIRMRTNPREVKKWEPQFKLELSVNDQHITNYYIDFKVWLCDGSIEYVEIKGFSTDVWRLKWRITGALWPKIPGVERKAQLVLVK